MASDLRDQFRHALQQEEAAIRPYFTCPLCEKCPVCSISAQRRKERDDYKHQEHVLLSLSMPDNWTSSFTSSSRRGYSTSLSTPGAQKQKQKQLPRSDSTHSLTPQQNSKNVRLADTLEQQQQMITRLEEVIAEGKAEATLLVNKLQYASLERKQLESKLGHRDMHISGLQERVRQLEKSLRESRAEGSEARSRLAISESCRSNTAKELRRCRLESNVSRGQRQRQGREQGQRHGRREGDVERGAAVQLASDISAVTLEIK